VSNIGLRRFAFSISAAAALLTGCGGIQSPIGAPGATPQSWMLPDTSSEDLLYVSDGVSNVYVYTYPQGQLVGTLADLTRPSGECVDTAGDVFILALPYKYSVKATIYEYAHGGTTPIATLTYPAEAFGCAVDPATGNLAVSGGARKFPGGVAIYKHASGKPKMYTWSQTFFFDCGYDDKSNLLLTAPGNGNTASLVRLDKGGNFEILKVSATLYYSFHPTVLPSVQWDGKHLTVSSAPRQNSKYPRTVYRFRIKGDDALVKGTTELTTPHNKFSGETWIQGSAIIGAYATYSRPAHWGLGSWGYPTGGKERGIAKVGPTPLQGIVVSPSVSR
jgi:hypothetical protein